MLAVDLVFYQLFCGWRYSNKTQLMIYYPDQICPGPKIDLLRRHRAYPQLKKIFHSFLIISSWKVQQRSKSLGKKSNSPTHNKRFCNNLNIQNRDNHHDKHDKKHLHRKRLSHLGQMEENKDTMQPPPPADPSWWWNWFLLFCPYKKNLYFWKKRWRDFFRPRAPIFGIIDVEGGGAGEGESL